MRLLGNILWIILGGIFIALSWFLLGIVLCITVIGIPFGLQCFKLAKLTLTPFGKEVDIKFFAHPIMNVIWALICGWEMAVAYFFSGIACCITIIGIPFGIQAFKFMLLALFPFGANVR